MTEIQAARLGGGRNLGRAMPPAAAQRATPAAPPSAAPHAPAVQAPQPAPAARAGTTAAPAAAPAAATPRSAASRWLAPLAGLAAGLGLAALAAHLGWGGGVLGVLILLVLGLLIGRALLAQRARGAMRSPRLQPVPAYSHTGLGSEAWLPNVPPAPPVSPDVGSWRASAPDKLPAQSAVAAPAGLDEAEFLRQAKAYFMRLQAAFDAGDLEDLGEFTTPEMFAELQATLGQRRDATQQTVVLTLEASLLGLVEVAGEDLASVRFRGAVREHSTAAATSIDEVWNFSRPRARPGGWVLAGLQQLCEPS